MCCHQNRPDEVILMNAHHIYFNDFIKYPLIFVFLRVSWGLKNEFESAAVNEQSLFESLKIYVLYCIDIFLLS